MQARHGERLLRTVSAPPGERVLLGLVRGVFSGEFSHRSRSQHLTPKPVVLVESKVSDLDASLSIVILKTIGFRFSIVYLVASAARLLDVPRNLRTQESRLLPV